MHPALRLLLARKLRGTLRKQLRRMRRPSGWVFGLLGLVLVGAWVLALAAPAVGGRRPALDPDELRLAVQAGCLVLTVLTLTSSFTHRGLYLPRDEIEVLFAAPLSRRDVVRYRLVTGVGRASFGSAILALVTVRHMPSPGLALPAVFLAAQTLPVAGQGLSILLGDAENRLAARLARLPLRWFQVLGVVAVLLFFAALALAPELGRLLRELGLGSLDGDLLGHPAVVATTAPFLPWARAITARSAAEFLPWFGACLALWLLLFELVARLRIDFRELSLATSADVARRLRRRQQGGGAASASEASRRSVGWRVPWLFGRGPAGAIAWRKSCSILRKARGTVFTSLLIVGGLTFASVALERGAGAESGLPGAILIALVGTLYLCAGLRFDFREDLEAMESIKAWPVPGWKAFVATLLPEVVFVSGLLAGAILLRAAVLGRFEPPVMLVVAALPVLVLLWTAIDNAVFLYLPVRFTPGQEGALHHTGRAMALMLLRLVAFAAVALAAVAALALRLLATEVLGWSDVAGRALSLGLLAVVLCCEILAVVAVGGQLFRRFDVARDRG